MLDFFRKLLRRWFGGPETPEASPEPEVEPPTVASPAEAAPEEPVKPPTAPEPTPPPPAPKSSPDPVPAGETAEATPVKPAPAEEAQAASAASQPSSRSVVAGEPAPRTAPRLARAYDPEELRLELIRYSSGPHDTLGRLYLNGEFVCYTHEAPAEEPRLPVGSHSLALREAGGKHAAYAFRFPDMHQGMLWIQDVPELPFAIVHLGKQYSETPGSIAVGLEVSGEADPSQPRQLRFGSRAYRALYLPVVTALSNGKPGRIVIETAGD